MCLALFIILPPYFPYTGSRLLASKPRDPSCFHSHSAGVTGTGGHAQPHLGVLGCELRSSCVHSKCSFPPSPLKGIRVILIFNFNFYAYGRLACVCLVLSRLEERV